MYRKIYQRVLVWIKKARQGSESTWSSAESAWWIITVFALLYFYWVWYPPPPGEAVAALGLLGVVVTFREKPGGLEKFLYVVFFIVLLRTEFKSIVTDREYHDTQQASALKLQSDNFNLILSNEQTGFKQTLNQEEAHFKQTLANVLGSQNSERTQFSNLVKQGRDLFTHQQELAESLTEKLLPASDPMPNNPCTRGQIDPEDLLLFIGSNTFVTHTFPHTVLKINNDDIVRLIGRVKVKFLSLPTSAVGTTAL